MAGLFSVIRRAREILVLGVLLTPLACTRRVHSAYQMTWACAPEPTGYRQSGAQLVRFQFVRNPHYYFYTSGLGLCDQLRASRKKIVSVELNLLGGALNGLNGFEDVSVEGKRVVYVGGWGTGESYECDAGVPCGPDPLREAFHQQ